MWFALAMHHMLATNKKASVLLLRMTEAEKKIEPKCAVDAQLWPIFLQLSLSHNGITHSASCLRFGLFQVLAEEVFDLVEWDLVHIVIKIGVNGIWHDHQLLIVTEFALYLLIHSFAEIAGVSLFTVNQ